MRRGESSPGNSSHGSSRRNGRVEERNGSNDNSRVNGHSKILLAVLCWYILGVLSISTSKLLLTDSSKNHSKILVGSVPPLFLTWQQLFIGSRFFRLLLKFNAFGSSGLQPWPTGVLSDEKSHHMADTRCIDLLKGWTSTSPELILTGFFFALGFLTTNYSFHQSSAAFVETIKAAEPITSAALAVTWGIETLGGPEVLSLATIVAGVLISTLANGPEATASATSTLSSSLQTALLVMITNLCFSFRGLYQKLFRSSPNGTVAVVDDLNFQYRVQQIGVMMLNLPVVILFGPELVLRIWNLYSSNELFQDGIVLQYIGLSLVNGLAFTCYNLASTYILTRISVVHHAVLNCIRRIFAIVVTSVAFGIPITPMKALGIALSFVGFMCFTKYKVKRKREVQQMQSSHSVSPV